MSESPSDQATLIDGLVADLEPVTPVRLVLVYAGALLLQALSVVVGAVWLGVGVESLRRMLDPHFFSIVLLLGVSGAACAMLAARLSVPGRAVDDRAASALAAVPLVLMAGIVLFAPWGAQWHGLGALALQGMPCTNRLVGVAIPTWTVLVLVLRRLGPLPALRIGLFAGLGCMLQAALVMQLACPVGDAFHLMVSHYFPIVVMSFVASALAGLLLRR